MRRIVFLILMLTTIAVATVPNVSNVAGPYSCDGSDTTFTFSFGLSDDDDIKVILVDSDGDPTTLTKTTHYTLSGATNDPQNFTSGGTVTTLTAYSSSYTIYLQRYTVAVQSLDIDDEDIEDAIDQLMRLGQDLKEAYARCLRIPVSESGDTTDFGKDGTAGYVYRDASGDFSTVVSVSSTAFGATTYIDTLIDDANSTEAQVTLDLVPGTDVQAYDADLLALGGVTSAANKVPYFTAAATASVADLSAFGRTLIDDAAATNGRTTLGLAIGTNVQAYDAELAALAGLTSAANKVPYFTASETASVADLSAFGLTLIDDAAATNARTTLGLAIGTNVQAYDPNLTLLAGADPNALDIPYWASTTTMSSMPVSAYARTLLDDAAATNARTTLGLAIGTNVQAYDADLSTYAGITPAANVQTFLGYANFAAMQAGLSTDDIQTLTGIAEGTAHLGTFTGATITDSSTIKVAIQEIETAIELWDTDGDGDIDTLDVNIVDDGSGGIVIGLAANTASHNATFDANGYLILLGDGRFEKEIELSPGDFLDGPAGPDATYSGSYAGLSYDISDASIADFEIPDDWDSGTNIVIEIYWYIDEAYATASAEVQWRVQWGACATNGSEAVNAPGASGSLDFGDQNIPATALYLTASSEQSISGASLSDGDLIGIKVDRVALDGGTGPTADPVIVRVEAHYTADRLGEEL